VAEALMIEIMLQPVVFAGYDLALNRAARTPGIAVAT
jgi:hypothetical protein